LGGAQRWSAYEAKNAVVKDLDVVERMSILQSEGSPWLGFSVRSGRLPPGKTLAVKSPTRMAQLTQAGYAVKLFVGLQVGHSWEVASKRPQYQHDFVIFPMPRTMPRDWG
jgi:hypothetical protein